MNYHDSIPRYSHLLYLLEDNPYIVYEAFKEMLREKIAYYRAINDLEQQIANISVKEIELSLDTILLK